MTRVLKIYWRPFAAILGLLVLAIVVGGYILGQQRLRFPFVEDSPVRMNVDLSSAQGVTPGQGQTVQVAGVRIGDIAGVELSDGRARVAVDIDREYADLIHPDAHAQLRPRTGLKDMYIQVFPGREGAPVGKGFEIPARNTMVDVNLDEILSTLDERTRDYLALLADGAGGGLRDRGADLAEVFKRFEPTFSDLRRVNRAVGTERVALRRLVSSVAHVNTKLASKPAQLSQLVDRASTTFDAFASEDDALRSSVGELAPTLRQATSALGAVQPFAQQLGPTTRALVPAVRELDDANARVRPFAREAAPIVRGQVRPFVRQARPVVRDLRPAARDLARAMPELQRDGKVVNDLFNMAGHNEGGRQSADVAGRDEGYLYWLAWASHQGANTQSVEDANGPIRPIFLTGTCTTLTSLVRDEPSAEFALGLSGLLGSVCKNPSTRSVDRAAALRSLPPLKKGAG